MTEEASRAETEMPRRLSEPPPGKSGDGADLATAGSVVTGATTAAAAPAGGDEGNSVVEQVIEQPEPADKEASTQKTLPSDIATPVPAPVDTAEMEPSSEQSVPEGVEPKQKKSKKEKKSKKDKKEKKEKEKERKKKKKKAKDVDSGASSPSSSKEKNSRKKSQDFAEASPPTEDDNSTALTAAATTLLVVGQQQPLRSENGESTPTTTTTATTDSSATTTLSDPLAPKRHGFTAVNDPQPSHRDPADQLLSEVAAAFSLPPPPPRQPESEPPAEGETDATPEDAMDVDDATPAKKQKRKRKSKAANGDAEEAEETATSVSGKKRKTSKKQKNDDEEGNEVPKKKKKKKSKAIAPQEEQSEEQEEESAADEEEHATLAEPVTQDPPVPEVPAQEATDVPAPNPPRPDTPPPRPQENPQSTPLQTPTPSKLKSKVAIAYERKKKRLEAQAAAQAAATASPAYTAGGATAGDASMEVPDDDADFEPLSHAPEPPKSTKRKKRRMPDLSATAVSAPEDAGETTEAADKPHRKRKKRVSLPRAHSSASLRSDSDEDAAIDPALRDPKTPSRKKSVSKRRETVTPTPVPIQPGTTSVSRVRPSYTYAPDPAPATPPNTGTFTQPECAMIDNYLSNFSTTHGLNSWQLNARIWGDISVLPHQSKQDREAFWRDLYALLPHRKRLAIYNHVRRRYHNFGVQGAKWDEDQDRELARLVTEKGSKWTHIGHLMGRLPDDCRDRWRNYLKCGEGRREKEWTSEEEDLLRKVVKEVRESMKRDRASTRVASSSSSAPPPPPVTGEAVVPIDITLTGEGGEGQAQAQAQTDLPPSPQDEDYEINWTVVSEKMGGWRSRIQCRYKWSKMMEWEERGGKARASAAPEGSSSVKKHTPRKTPTKAKSNDDREDHGENNDNAESGDENEDDEAAQQDTPVAKKKSKKSNGKDKTSKKSNAAKGKSTKTPKSSKHSSKKRTQNGQPRITPFLQMLPGDRIWLLESILSHNPASHTDIPWSDIASSHIDSTATSNAGAEKQGKPIWNAKQLERAFLRMVKRGIPKRERDVLGLVQRAETLLAELRKLPEDVKIQRYVPGGLEGNGEVDTEGSEDEEGGGEDEEDSERQEGEQEKEKKGESGKKGKQQGVTSASSQAHLRDAVQLAMEQLKERERTETLARVLLSQVQEAYGN